MKIPGLWMLLLIVIATSCTEREPEGAGVGTVDGYRPIYMEKNKAMQVDIKGVQPLEDPGKIYWYYNYMMLTDKGKGVHVIDISNPASPQKVSFISIPGVNDVAVKSNFLYADNITDLVVFNISNVQNITYEKRVKDVYPLDNQMYPDHVTGYFECVDTTKGYVIGWQKVTLEDPKCRR